uniref:Polyprotein n=1 Tax=Bemisia tabaci beny-like virus 3 TaxID=2840010 RepID=A0A8E8FU80_9VIRU|nr:polyprotein [Bemisia tabaci beny-like virus 3]
MEMPRIKNPPKAGQFRVSPNRPKLPPELEKQRIKMLKDNIEIVRNKTDTKPVQIRGDCWEKLFKKPDLFYTNDDYTYVRSDFPMHGKEIISRCDGGGGIYRCPLPRARTMAQLVGMIADCMKPQGPELFDHCYHVNGPANCDRCASLPINSRENILVSLSLEFAVTGEGMLHLVSAGKRTTVYKYSFAGTVEFGYNTLISMCAKPLFGQAMLSQVLPEMKIFEKDLTPDQPYYNLDFVANYVIGIEAEQMIEECKRLHTADLARAQAQSSFISDVRSVPKVNVRLSDSEKLALKSYLGFAVMSNNKEMSTSDHKFLQVSRELIRRSLRGFFPEQTDVASVLHVGCTIYEVRQWKPNVGHDFLLGLYEDRDVGRIFDALVSEVGKIVGIKKARGMAPREVVNRTINYQGMNDLLRFLNAAYSRDRVFTSFPNRTYGTLMFEDSLYDMSDEQFLKYFRDSGATTGFATIFIPDQFLVNEAITSEIYTLNEYYDSELITKDWLTVIWPQICLLTPYLPWDTILETVHSVFHWLGTKGMHLVLNWLKQLPNSKFPVEEISGVAFDAVKFKSIIEVISDALRNYIRKHYLKVRLIWKGGFDVGYNHKWNSWRRWITTRRISAEDGFCIDWTVHERIGEMYLLRFYRSSGSSDITYSMQLPADKTTVMVADVQSAWSPVTKTLGDMEYFPVLAKNWYQLYNWAMAEPADSLDFSVMLTTLNRIRGGLSLNSNVLVEAMRIQDTEAVKVALACLLEVLRIKGVIGDINNVKENLIAYKTNIEMLLRSLATTAATICTAGLIVPAAFLLKWMFDANPAYVFVKETTPPNIVTVRAKRGTMSPRTILESSIASHVFEVKSETFDTACSMCKYQNAGLFSSGDVNEGQQFVCHTKKKKPVQLIEVSSSEMVDIVAFLTSAQEHHLSSEPITKAIKATKRILESNPNGISREVEVDFITGGPGTGKSVVIRELAAMYEDSGLLVHVVVPFDALRQEYYNAKMLRAPDRTFTATTPFHALAAGASDVLIVDEATAVSWQLIYALLIKHGPKHLILVGDKSQTKLNAAQGEGLDILSYNLNWETIPTHEMIWNYRLDAWRVKFLNKTYGYSMRTRRLDDIPPTVMTIEQYKEAVANTSLVIGRELVFSHSSSEGTFGYVSNAAKISNIENHSVRTAQGMTYDNVAVSYSLADTNVASAHGMLCVAISRARYKTVFVVHTASDEHITLLKQKLCIDTEEKIAEISAMDYPNVESNFVVAETRNPRLDPLIDEKIAEKEIEDETPKFVEMKYATETVVFPDNISFTSARDDLYEFYKTIFHTCVTDMLLDVFSHVEGSKDKVISELSKIYLDDVKMGRREKKWNEGSKEKLPKRDGKYLLPTTMILDIFKETPGAILLSEAGVVLAYGGESKSLFSFYQLRGSHVTPFDEHYRRIPVWCAGKLMTAESMLYMHNKKFLGEYPFVKKSGTYCFVLPQDALDELYEYEQQFSIKEHTVSKYAGYKLTRFKMPEMCREQLRIVQMHTPVMSSYKVADDQEEKELRVSKLRLGKDAYKLGRLLDPSGAYPGPCLNNVAPFLGPKHVRGIVLNWDGFIFNRTKANKLIRYRQQSYRAVAPGMANHYNNSPEETLIAAQRLANPETKPALTGEAKSFAKKVAEHAFKTHFEAAKTEDWCEYNTILSKAFSDIVARNYYNRSISEVKPFSRKILKFHNKDQIKPIKNDSLDLTKGGQGILQTPANVNLEFVAWMRIMNKMFFNAKQPHFHYDNLIPTEIFRRDLSRAIAKMPKSASIAIVDAKSFDSQQSQVTLEIERQFMGLLGAKMPILEKYYDVRGPMPFRAFGVFSGKTMGEKGSGFPDTLIGNTILQTCISTYVLKGIGPMCVAAKGDDHLRIQSGLSVDEAALKEVKLFTNMVLDITIGVGGEFCGDTITPIGAFPSINRAAIKTVAMRSKSYQDFAEKQQSLRDKIKEYQHCGLEETVAYASVAEQVSLNRTWASLAFINSMAHINENQWKAITRRFKKMKYYLPTAKGPTII